MEPVRCARAAIKSKSVNEKIWHRSVNCRSFARQKHRLLCLAAEQESSVKSNSHLECSDVFVFTVFERASASSHECVADAE